MYRTLLIAIVAAASARADMIPYATLVTDTTMPTGRHLDFDGVLSVPGFNPDLGLLYSIDYELAVAGSGFPLLWETISRSQWGVTFSDFNVSTATTFLGSTLTRFSGPVYGNGGLPCGVPAYPEPCRPTTSKFDNSGAVRWQGSVTTNLSAFMLPTPIYVPVSVAIDASPWPGLTVFGNLLGEHQMGFYVDWKYNYTPAPIVTHTPEPRHAGLLLLVALLGYCAWRRR